jgi:flagellar M-ring protein FliF
MDILNKSYAQLVELFSSMSGGARLITGLLMVFVIITLTYSVTHEVSGPDAYLFGANPLTDREVTVVSVAFSKMGLNDWDTTGNRIRVPRDQRYTYLAALADNDSLPNFPFSALSKLSKNSSIWSSENQRQDNLKIANEIELSLMIRKMSGIDNAVVKYKETREGTFSKRDRKVTGVVSVWPTPGIKLTDKRVASIQNTVAAAVASKPELVKVVDMVSGETCSDNLSDSGAGSNEYQRSRRLWENFFSDKVRAALSYIPDASVVVNVNFDEKLRERRTAKVVDSESSFAAAIPTSGQSTFSPNPPDDPNARRLPTRGNSSAELSHKTHIQNISESETTTKTPSRDIVKTTKADLVPTTVTVAIGIPKSYYRNLWKKENPFQEGHKSTLRTTEQMATFEESINHDIRRLVTNSVPTIQSTTNPSDAITVVSFENTLVPPVTDPPATARVANWLNQNWSTLGMMGIGVFSLLILRSMIRSIPPVATSPVVALEETISSSNSLSTSPPETEGADNDSGNPDSGNPELFLHRRATTSTIRDELAEVVRDDPEAAAKVLSTWIGNAE